MTDLRLLELNSLYEPMAAAAHPCRASRNIKLTNLFSRLALAPTANQIVSAGDGEIAKARARGRARNRRNGKSRRRGQSED